MQLSPGTEGTAAGGALRLAKPLETSHCPARAFQAEGLCEGGSQWTGGGWGKSVGRGLPSSPLAFPFLPPASRVEQILGLVGRNHPGKPASAPSPQFLSFKEAPCFGGQEDALARLSEALGHLEKVCF